jgi:hypothetical protein
MAQVLTESFELRCTKAEKAGWEKFARSEGRSLSAQIRFVMNRLAGVPMPPSAKRGKKAA